MEIALAILGISLLVVIHETGHYLAARAFKMRVLRYSIGFGPVLFKYQPQGSPTIFQVCAIPFLAYVQIDGMNPTDDVDRNDPTLFPNKSVFARIVTIFAGPFANYLAASVIIFGVAIGFGIPDVDLEGPMVISEVIAGDPAAVAGLRRGDRIIEADHRPVRNIEDLTGITGPRAEQPTEYVVMRGDERLVFTITPEPSTDGDPRGLIGVGAPVRTIHLSAAAAALYSLEWPIARSIENLQGLASMVQRRTMEGLAGPLGMTKLAARQVERGARHYIVFIALISTALGLFNLLPFPALDGGRLVFLFFELITRRRANERVEALVHTVGLLFLLGLIVVITFRET
jgi:regulator of sigma E protease